MKTIGFLWLACAGLGCLASAGAASERDPTRAPEAAWAASAPATRPATGNAAGPADIDAALQQRLVLDGRPYLVERGWLRGVGDQLGTARIERITEREVWLRQNGELHKWPLYPNVQMLALPDAPASAARPTAHPRALPPAALKESRP